MRKTEFYFIDYIFHLFFFFCMNQSLSLLSTLRIKWLLANNEMQKKKNRNNMVKKNSINYIFRFRSPYLSYFWVSTLISFSASEVHYTQVDKSQLALI